MTRDKIGNGSTLLWYLDDDMHLELNKDGRWEVKGKHREDWSVFCVNKNPKSTKVILRKGKCLCIAKIGPDKFFEAWGWK